jgi:hypothetical protein
VHGLQQVEDEVIEIPFANAPQILGMKPLRVVPEGGGREAVFLEPGVKWRQIGPRDRPCC